MESSGRSSIKQSLVNKVLPQVGEIKAAPLDNTSGKVLNKQARYRFVIDVSTM
jgi:hypothetical protein